ncbi:MAG TPA: ABC transporter substrate-binding protein [Tissierellaceae bacterium]|nr:ABC transporter substrate-binding protein [Clostridiales bacterium]HZK01048.1 ABC transporter substrate-binding protein [Tissierellaceae bacterium]
MTKKRIGMLLVLVMAFTVVLTGCGAKDDAGETPTGDAPVESPSDTGDADTGGEPSGTLKVGITEASGNFNPLYYSSAYDGYVVNLVFQGLARTNFDGDEYEGVVAKDWTISDDLKSITFELRDDIVFSDGEPLTASDVVFTYKALADPSYDGRYGSTVKDLEGYDEYYAKETEEFPGVVADGDYKVTFNFKEALRTNFANTTFEIMPEHYYGNDFVYGDTSSLAEFSSEPIGSGPYVVEDYTEAQFIYLNRNDKFADDGYMIKEILMQFVDMSTDIVQFMNDEVDLLYGVIEPAKIKEARDGGKEMNTYSRSGYGYVKTNNEAGPTADPEVRKALYYAFDIQGFVDSYFEDPDTGEPLASTQYHPFSTSSWALDESFEAELVQYTYDIEKAKQILDDAGWVVGSSGFREKDGQVLDIKVAAMPDHDILETLVPMWQASWGEELQAKVNVSFQEFNTILDYVIYDSDSNVDEWSLFFLATSITSADPHSLYTSFHSDHIGSGKDNTSRYNNPEVDRLLDEGKVIVDPDEARPIYQDVVKILNEDAVMMPVYANIYHDLYSPKLKNFTTAPLYDWTRAMEDATMED